MLARRVLYLLLLLLSICVTGCFSLVMYVDPDLEKVSAEQLDQGRRKQAVGFSVEWQTNGNPNAAVTGSFRDQVAGALESTGLFSLVLKSEIGVDVRFTFVCNNAGGESSGSGYATGLTLGAVGTATIDRYQFTATMISPDGMKTRKEYNHALHGTIGAKHGPENLKPLRPTEAVETMVREVVMLFLRDLQASGLI